MLILLDPVFVNKNNSDSDTELLNEFFTQ
ncbi:hypothetical protein PM8797T_23896 [Gimesia maris DSM 8797]|nr:hypothetical protein PM8797T_23896 [Gimesia maris DSM 8797]